MEKQSILAKIYYANRECQDPSKESTEYWKIMDEVIKLSENLNEKLNQEEKELFRNFSFASIGLEAETALTNFTEGMKFGLLLGKEVFGE